MTKLAGTVMTIFDEGALLVAKATAIKVSTMNAARADRKAEDWARGALEGRGESRLFPSKFKFKDAESAMRSFQLNQIKNLLCSSCLQFYD